MKKLKIQGDRLRAVSDVYCISMQELARKAERRWTKGRETFKGYYPTEETEITVIDVEDIHTNDEWKEIIAKYTETEFNKLPETIPRQVQKLKDDAIKKTYLEV